MELFINNELGQVYSVLNTGGCADSKRATKENIDKVIVFRGFLSKMGRWSLICYPATQTERHEGTSLHTFINPRHLRLKNACFDIQ